MADIRFYRAYHNDIDIEVTLTIDHDILTSERALAINAFWTEGDGRLLLCDDDAHQVVARLAGQTAIAWLAREECWTVEQLNSGLSEEEGWGDYNFNGIRFMSFDGGLSLEFGDICCEEIEQSSEVVNG